MASKIFAALGVSQLLRRREVSSRGTLGLFQTPWILFTSLTGWPLPDVPILGHRQL